MVYTISMRYTVKQLSKLAGVTSRTLHYYDEIGLLRPTAYGQNGYRIYDDEALLQLQQILFFRELDFSLEQIKAILDRPDFDVMHALQNHRSALLERADRLNILIETVDRTIQHIRGELQLSAKDFYSGFDEEQQKRRAEQAQQRWGDKVAQSQKRWNAYSRTEKNDILAEMQAISAGIAALMDQPPSNPQVQAWIERWYRHINTYFYDCSLEVFETLGHIYTQDSEFEATYEKIRPGLAAFMEQAMLYFVQEQRLIPHLD